MVVCTCHVRPRCFLQMILRRGYGKGVDWWSMGALAYEMMSGYPPFKGKTSKDLNRSILNDKVRPSAFLVWLSYQVSHNSFGLDSLRKQDLD